MKNETLDDVYLTGVGYRRYFGRVFAPKSYTESWRTNGNEVEEQICLPFKRHGYFGFGLHDAC